VDFYRAGGEGWEEGIIAVYVITEAMNEKEQCGGRCCGLEGVLVYAYGKLGR